MADRLRVEVVEFGNDRLDALDGWQGIAYAVTTPEGEVLTLSLTEAEAQAVVRAYSPPEVLTLEPVGGYVLHYVSQDVPGGPEAPWSVYREQYPHRDADEPIDGTQEHVSTWPTEDRAREEAGWLQDQSNPGS